MLPTDFIHMMQPLLGAEWQDFIDALHTEPTRGVRISRGQVLTTHPDTVGQSESKPILSVQTAKIAIPSHVTKHLKNPVPWTQNGFYVDVNSPLGKSVYHEAGAYYMQEPSAMAVVEALAPTPGEYIIDLCAAPGGKCTEIGRRLAGEGLLVANEIHPKRVVILAENIERLGIPAVVTQESSERLAAAWPMCFDAILVDAPCSGEGMFRKERKAAEEWSIDAPAICSNRQREILRSASVLIRPGGRLVYSTCTFNPYENEQMIDWLVEQLGYEIEDLPNWPGWSSGIPEWGSGKLYLQKTRRLWPHHGQGEGHFVARLRKEGNQTTKLQDLLDSSRKKISTTQTVQAWNQWAADLIQSRDLPPTWKTPIVHHKYLFSDELKGLPEARLKILRPGVPLATIETHGIVPQHTLAMCSSAEAFRNALSVSETTAIRYCEGQTLVADNITGIRHIQVDQFPLGWGKGLRDRINNLYPKGLRKQNLLALSAFSD